MMKYGKSRGNLKKQKLVKKSSFKGIYVLNYSSIINYEPGLGKSSSSSSSSGSVRNFCPLPMGVKENDPRRVLLKDVFNYINQKYEDILNSDFGKNDDVSSVLMERKSILKYFYNNVLQLLDRHIAAESKGSSSMDEGSDSVSLINSFLEMSNDHGCEIFNGIISLTKSEKLRAEIKRSLNEWDDSFKEFFCRGFKIMFLVNNMNKDLNDLDSKSTFGVWECCADLQNDDWPCELLSSMSDEVKWDPRFLIFKEWYNSVEKRSEYFLEKHTGTSSEFRDYIVNFQLTLKYYFGHILEELESHIKFNSFSCESGDIGVLLIEGFISESFNMFSFHVNSVISGGGLPKVGQVKVEKSMEEFSKFFDEFMKRSKNLVDEVNKVKEKGHLSVNPFPMDGLKSNSVESVLSSVEIRGFGTFYITKRMVGLDPRLLLLNDSCQYSQDMCDYLLNNVLSSWDFMSREIVKNFEKVLISRYDVVVSWMVNYVSSTYFHPEVFGSDKSVAKINNLLKECNVYGVDVIKSLISKSWSKRCIKELQELFEEWEKFNGVFASRGLFLMSDVNVFKSQLLSPLTKSLSLAELKELSVGLVKSVHPSLSSSDNPVGSGLIEKDL